MPILSYSRWTMGQVEELSSIYTVPIMYLRSWTSSGSVIHFFDSLSVTFVRFWNEIASLWYRFDPLDTGLIIVFVVYQIMSFFNFIYTYMISLFSFFHGLEFLKDTLGHYLGRTQWRPLFRIRCFSLTICCLFILNSIRVGTWELRELNFRKLWHLIFSIFNLVTWLVI